VCVVLYPSGYVVYCADYHKGIGMCTSINVCISSAPVLLHTTHTHVETKNTWARDDPAILILIAGGMLGDSLAVTIVYQHLRCL
jgi:UNC-50 family